MIGIVRRSPSATGRLLRSVGRGLAVVAVWAVALGIGVGGFFTGSRPGQYEAIAFGLAFALASAVAGGTTLAMGGRGRLAIEGAAAIVATVLIAAGAVAGLLWLDPFTAQRLAGIGSQELIAYRGQLVTIVRDFGRPRFPTGPILGLAVGTIGGLLMRLAGRRPRFAAMLAVGLLVTVAASASVAGGVVADIVLDARRERGKWAVSWLNPIEVAGTIGSVAGSVFGAIAACGMLRGSRGRSPTKPSGDP